MAFRHWSFALKLVEGFSPSFPLNSFLNAQIGKHIILSNFEERCEPLLGLMLGSLMQRGDGVM